MIRITPSRKTTYVGPVVSRVALVRAWTHVPAREPALARANTMGTKRPISMVRPSRVLYHGVFADDKGRTVVLRSRGEGVGDLGESVPARVQNGAGAGVDHQGHAPQHEDGDGKSQHVGDDQLHLAGLDLRRNFLEGCGHRAMRWQGQRSRSERGTLLQMVGGLCLGR
jgi:hypothetical protein